MNPTPTKHNSSARHVFYTGKFSLDPSFPKYYILSASGGCQVSSGDDNDTHKYKDKDLDKDPTKQGFQGYEEQYFLIKNSPSKIMFTQGFVDPGPEYFSGSFASSLPTPKVS